MFYFSLMIEFIRESIRKSVLQNVSSVLNSITILKQLYKAGMLFCYYKTNKQVFK